MKSTHQNVVSLNRFFLRSVKRQACVDSVGASEIFDVDPMFCKRLADMEDARLEALVRTVNAPMLTGGKMHSAIWELFTRELDDVSDIKQTCAQLNKIIKMQRND